MRDPEDESARLPEQNENGVDLTLVRRTLAMTATERVRYHQAALADVERLAKAGEAARRGRI